MVFTSNDGQGGRLRTTRAILFAAFATSFAACGGTSAKMDGSVDKPGSSKDAATHAPGDAADAAETRATSNDAPAEAPLTDARIDAVDGTETGTTSNDAPAEAPLTDARGDATDSAEAGATGCSLPPVKCSNGITVDPCTDNIYCGVTTSCDTPPASGGNCTFKSNAGEYVCQSGVCVCAPGTISCASGCVDPMTSAQYCGARGDCQGANAGMSCGLGACTAGHC
jgi:hypothetical protein